MGSNSIRARIRGWLYRHFTTYCTDLRHRQARQVRTYYDGSVHEFRTGHHHLSRPH